MPSLVEAKLKRKKKKKKRSRIDHDNDSFMAFNRWLYEPWMWMFAPFYGVVGGPSAAEISTGSPMPSNPTSPAYPGPGGINAPGVPAGPNSGMGPVTASLDPEEDVLEHTNTSSTAPTGIIMSAMFPANIVDKWFALDRMQLKREGITPIGVGLARDKHTIDCHVISAPDAEAFFREKANEWGSEVSFEYPKAQDMDLPLQEGGPGSGGGETKTIDMPLSDYVSVGTRKSLLTCMPFEEDEIDLADIVAVGQKTYVPKKRKNFVKNPDILKDLPVDLLKVADGYHVIDGHHRFLAAQDLKMPRIKARVYVHRDCVGDMNNRWLDGDQE